MKSSIDEKEEVSIMSAAVENLMYVSNEENGRFVPWHGLGTPVKEAPTSHDAIRMAGLDWNVDSKPIFTADGMEIPGYKANTRDIDESVLGIVSDRYQVVQNKEAFEFTDILIGEGCTYETAGSLFNGKKIFLLAKMPSTRILGDDVEPYLCFTNNHSGTGAIQACITPIRVVCNNTLNLALNQASRKWSTRHVGDIASKLAEAKHTLMLADDYMTKLDVEADKLANIKISTDETMKMVEELFPIAEDVSERRKATIVQVRNDFINCLNAPDIVQFKNTGWGMINAASDFMSHSTPKRNTSTYAERNFNRILEGHEVLDNVYHLVNRLAA